MNKQDMLGGSVPQGMGGLERKDDGGASPEADTKKAITNVMTAFDEFKATNDERLKEIESKGSPDVVITEKLDKIETTLSAYEGMNQKLTQMEGQQKSLDDLQEQYDKLETAMKRTGGDTSTEAKAVRVDNWAHAVVHAHTQGVANLSEEQRKSIVDIQGEYKALGVSTDTQGGYLAPVELVREIIKGETEISPVRSLARVRQTASKSVQFPKRTGQFSAQWVTEQGPKSETAGLEYGLDEIHTHELFALIDISNQMLEDSAFNMNGEISSESSEQFALAEGSAFATGNGVGKPEGFLVNSGVGSDNSGSATTIADANGQANGLLTLKHAIKSAYARRANWVMNRTTLGSVRKLKDGNNQYIWMPGIAQGRPNTIDGDPYIELPDMPNEGAGATPIAYGDFFRAYTWVDRIAMEMLRDPYTQATSGNVRFVMRKRVGGQVVLAEAVRKLTCAA